MRPLPEETSMIRVPGILLSLPCILVVSACADPSPPAQERMAQPEVGLSAQALERATAALQAHIDAGDIPGVVAAVARDGELVYLESLGVLDVDTGAPMPPDALFRIYSMTRPI